MGAALAARITRDVDVAFLNKADLPVVSPLDYVDDFCNADTRLSVVPVVLHALSANTHTRASQMATFTPMRILYEPN